MHKLDRTAVPAPPCLSSYAHGSQNWGDLTPEHKNEVRTHLEQLQGRRCAYCEASLDICGQHIDHFRPKHRFQSLMFAWNNLFWSCDSGDRCGHFKEHGAGPYRPEELIDPSIDDPERFFRFFSDGSIRLKPGLTDAERHRANETLRVFNLDADHGPLRRMRRTHCAGYITVGEEIAEMAQYAAPEEWSLILDLELASTRHLPFATAIKHTLSVMEV